MNNGARKHFYAIGLYLVAFCVAAYLLIDDLALSPFKEQYIWDFLMIVCMVLSVVRIIRNIKRIKEYKNQNIKGVSKDGKPTNATTT